MKRSLLFAASLLLCSCGGAANKSDAPGKAEFRPKAGERVLAEWGSETFEEAAIKSVEGNQAKVVFGDGSENTVKYPEGVAPIPASAAKVSPGDYVLGQYPHQKQMWIGGKVNSATDSSVNVKFSNTWADEDVPADKVVRAPEYMIPDIKKALGQ